MSLLMEALKKAERAKQAVEEQGGRQQPAPEGADLQPSPDDPAVAAPEAAAETPAGGVGEAAAPVRDPRQRRLDYPRLELESIDDKEFELDPVKPRVPRPMPAQDAAAEERSRAAARTVFDAKLPAAEQKSRAPVLIGAVVVLAAIGVGAYLWMQTQGSSATLVNPQQAAGTVPRQPAPMPPAMPAATPAAPAAQAGNPGSPMAGAAAATPPAAAPGAVATAPKPETRAPAPGPRSVARTIAPKAAPTFNSSVRISAPTVTTDPVLEQAYAAYLGNDLTLARTRYQAMLAIDPDNRDVLLGLAAIAARERRLDDAESLYLRILQLDPADAYAQTGLIAIRNQVDPLASESRLKTLIANEPDAAYLHSALGNLYAKLARWNDAQQEYFRAFSLDATSADYCYNLAVSLDQLHQNQLARAHYERALALSASRPASFDPTRLRARISELKQY